MHFPELPVNYPGLLSGDTTSCINISWSALQQHVLISDYSRVRKNYFLIRICPTTNVLISDNLPVRKSYFDSNII